MEQWQLQQRAAIPSEAGRTAIGDQLAKWGVDIKRYDKEEAEAQEGAEQARKEYEHLELRNDQFHFTEALFSLSIALFAVASLARSRMLFGLGLFFATCGIGLGFAGFLGWTVRPGAGIFG